MKWYEVWITSYDQCRRMGANEEQASITATKTLGRLLAENPSLFKVAKLDPSRN